MGEVYRARDLRLGRDIAIKVLPDAFSRDPERLARFTREAHLLASLNHPAIGAIHGLEEAEGVRFLVLELVSGSTLGQRLSRGGLPWREALTLCRQIAEALEDAHAKGIIHRDLKPANVQVTPEGRVKLLDFGLGKAFGASAGLASDPTDSPTVSGPPTEEGFVIGTAAYMSPEQARGQPVDKRTDVWAFGCVVYETLTGKRAFPGSTVSDTLVAVLEREPDWAALPAQTSDGIRSLLRRCLQKDKNQRLHDIADARIEIEEDLADAAAASDPRHRPPAPGRSRRVWWWAAASAVVLALALGALALWRRGPAPVQRPTAPVSVLIADFENGTSDPVFNGTLEPVLGIALEGATFINSYARGDARKAAARLRAGATRLDEGLARLVAVREGVNVVVSGSLAAAAPGYRISVQAVDAATGKVLARTQTDVSGKEDVLPGVGRLAASLRKSLGDTAPESVRLGAGETFTSTSLEAAHEYAVAQELGRRGEWQEAIGHYTRAVELDPEFGRAYAGLAVIYFNHGQRQEAEKHFRLALSRIDRMTERERFRTRSSYYGMTRNYPKAIEELTALLARYPTDDAGRGNLALAYFYARNMPRALEEGRRAVQLAPQNVVQRSNLALYAVYAGDFEAAAREAQGALEMNSRHVNANLALALAELGRGRRTEASEVYQRMSALSPWGKSQATSGMADLALHEGRLADAAQLLEKGITEDQASGNADAAASKLALLARIQLELGRRSQAVGSAGRAVATARGESVLFPAAQVYLGAGQPAKASRLAAELAGRLEPEPQMYAKLLEGESALGRGDARAAVKTFQEAQKIADSWLGRFELGRAYLQAGAFTEASSEFEECLRRRGEAVAVFLDDVPSYHLLDPVYYHLARAQEGLGSPGAAESYRLFLAPKAERSDDPLVADARRREKAENRQSRGRP